MIRSSFHGELAGAYNIYWLINNIAVVIHGVKNMKINAWPTNFHVCK
jgi:hypothetical protein